MERPYFTSIWKKVGQAIADYKLIEEGDRIGVGLSGGKDSLVLAWVLSTLARIAPVRFSVIGLSVDLGWGDDLSGVTRYCASIGIEHHVKASTIGPIVFKTRRESNPCSLCAHLRRGSLNSLAQAHGLNKVALAHHLDDAIETLLMSMFYAGRIQCFHPKTYLDETDLTVIRPLVYVEESSIVRAANEMALPVVKNSCPAAGMTARQHMKQLLSGLTSASGDVRHRLRTCLSSLWTASTALD